MTIELKELSKASTEYKQVKALYYSAFPKEERPPFTFLIRRMKKSCAQFLSVFCDGEWSGFAYVVTNRELAYLFFLAIDECKQGQGIGSATLKALANRFEGKNLFLAIEELDEKYSNFSERVRRKHFYERNGFHSLNTKMLEEGVIYDLMSFGDEILPSDYDDMMKNFVGKIHIKKFKTRIYKA